MLINMRELSPALVRLIKESGGKLNADLRSMLREELIAAASKDDDLSKDAEQRKFEIAERCEQIDKYLGDVNSIWEVSARSMTHSIQRALEHLEGLSNAVTAIARRMNSPQQIYYLGGVATSLALAEDLLGSATDNLLPNVREASFLMSGSDAAEKGESDG